MEFIKIWNLFRSIKLCKTDINMRSWNYLSLIAALIMFICGASSEFVSSSIPSWQILTAHAQPFRGARDLAFCLKVSLDSLLVWASSGGSGETTRMRRLAWTFAARIGNKYQICLTRPFHVVWLVEKTATRKTPKNSDTCNYPKIVTMWFYRRASQKMQTQWQTV